MMLDGISTQLHCMRRCLLGDSSTLRARSHSAGIDIYLPNRPPQPIMRFEFHKFLYILRLIR
jgi:hypothetical protein